ncbi:MAG: RodZ domain-containing protein [Pseudomonadota bacterium]
MSGTELKATPGAVLARAREGLGVSQRDVADALNLPLTTIVALEEDNTERLPAYVFTRGYLRAYAKLLDLDPDPLVATLAQELRDEGGEQKEYVPARTVLGFDYRMVLGVAVAVGVFVGAVVWFALRDDETPEVAPNAIATAPASTSASGENDDVSQDVVAAAPTDTTPATASPATQMPPESTHDLTVQAIDVSPQETVSVQAAALEVAPDEPGTRRLTRDGSARLRLTFTEECWVSIEDAGGVGLFGDMGRPGRVMNFVGQGPFNILLGYAPGVALAYNGENVPLAPHTRNNVARLVIGQ